MILFIAYKSEQIPAIVVLLQTIGMDSSTEGRFAERSILYNYRLLIIDIAKKFLKPFNALKIDIGVKGGC